ncbi:hypothetical protein H6P81_013770 [Aristolochia fimbriata]|uniref:Uncharacterized protein n=1 Tax=Aristolochia fimbriata TaxID=158543 RepID=A0AAV7EJ84_ARIFI|nr:hypothetical protein H6P81_013770 [Aristolochia fimbriata]
MATPYPGQWVQKEKDDEESNGSCPRTSKVGPVGPQRLHGAPNESDPTATLCKNPLQRIQPTRDILSNTHPLRFRPIISIFH